MIEVRKATREDAKDVWEIRKAAILSECVGYYPAEALQVWTQGDFTEKFAETVAEHFYVSEVDGVVAGTGLVDLDKGKIDALFVAPNFMRRGVGRVTMAFLEKMAQRNGVKELYLESTLNAAPFYRQCGFQGDSVSEYKSPTGISLDCILMVKKLRRTGHRKRSAHTAE